MSFKIQAAQRMFGPKKSGGSRFITEGELRAIGNKAASEAGMTAAELLSQHVAKQEPTFADTFRDIFSGNNQPSVQTQVRRLQLDSLSNFQHLARLRQIQDAIIEGYETNDAEALIRNNRIE